MRRVRRRDPATGGDPYVVFAAASCAQFGSDVDARVLTAWADAADPNRLAKAPAHVARATSVDLAADAPGARTACRREPASPVALVGASSGHQGTRVSIEARDGLCGYLRSAVCAFILASVDGCFPAYSTVVSLKIVEPQSMSRLADRWMGIGGITPAKGRLCGPQPNERRGAGVIGRTRIVRSARKRSRRSKRENHSERRNVKSFRTPKRKNHSERQNAKIIPNADALDSDLRPRKKLSNRVKTANFRIIRAVQRVDGQVYQ